jgi:hydroxymethylpyrimidine pyrophosphatase-like HAD family hydrolase
MNYVIGIDLHGTLLDNDWEIKPKFHSALLKTLQTVSDFSKIYICTGNDLSFIDTYVPSAIRNCFSGFILETGCVLSDGKHETIIIPTEKIVNVKDLEKLLKGMEFPEVKYFARRHCTISMFTRTENGGSDPACLKPRVEKAVQQLGFGDAVQVTHSNVAVDIIPLGFNKFTGIHHVAEGLKTIGIADSLNDIHLLIDATWAFIPANSSAGLIRELGLVKRQVRPLAEWNVNADKSIWRSHYSTTEGVLDILKFLEHNFNQNA